MEPDRAYFRVLLRDPCVYCYGQATGLDHIRPRSSYVPAPRSRQLWRWMNGWENRAPACMRCDNAKGAQPLIAFLLMRQREGLPDVTPDQRRRSRGLIRAEQRRLRREGHVEAATRMEASL